MEKIWQESDEIHRLRLRAPEEDEYLLIHNFSTLKIWSFASMVNEAKPYLYFDQLIAQDDKDRIMRFYRSCIQRHYYYHGRYQKHYLSKSPNFSPAIKTLLENFPDAKFIYLVRNPLQAVTSHISLKDREWRLLGSPLTRYACIDFIIESSRHWYSYPLEVLDDLPEKQAVIVKFENLVSDAGNTVKKVYNQLGLTLSNQFLEILDQETIKARNHTSKHHYSLDAMGLTQIDLEGQFAKVMKRFNYL
jgi:hypothetical protein